MTDLIWCVDQIQSTEEQPFAWDTTLAGRVTEHEPVPPPTFPSNTEEDRNEATSDSEMEEKLDDEVDEEGVRRRADILQGEIRLIKLDPTRTKGDQWALARSVLFLFFSSLQRVLEFEKRL